MKKENMLLWLMGIVIVYIFFTAFNFAGSYLLVKECPDGLIQIKEARTPIGMQKLNPLWFFKTRDAFCIPEFQLKIIPICINESICYNKEVKVYYNESFLVKENN